MKSYHSGIFPFLRVCACSTFSKSVFNAIREIRGWLPPLSVARPKLVSNGSFPDSCVLIEPFIGNAVKNEFILVQPFQIVDFIGILQRNCARLRTGGNTNNKDRRSSPKLEVGPALSRARLECDIGDRLPVW